MTEAPDSLLGDAQEHRTAELAGTTPVGCFVEVGVYKGGSAWHLAQVASHQRRKLHLFDTFTGIPFKGSLDVHEVGDFGDVSLDAVRRAIPSAVFHVGVFPSTVPDDMDNVAFVHCDCDQLDSVVSVIGAMVPRLVPGGIIAFDDMNQGAVRDYLQNKFEGRLIEYMGVWHMRFG
jgi:hypothetical protein